MLISGVLTCSNEECQGPAD